jgi:Peptidase family M48
MGARTPGGAPVAAQSAPLVGWAAVAERSQRPEPQRSNGSGSSRSGHARRRRRPSGSGSGAQRSNNAPKGAKTASKASARGGGSAGRRTGARPAPPAAPVTAPPPSEDAAVLAQQTSHVHRRRALELTVGAAAVSALVVGGILVAVVNPLVGVLVGIAVGVLKGLAIWFSAPRLTLRLLGAQPAEQVLDEAAEARLANLAEGLCATLGLRPPALWAVRDRIPNACSVGKNPRDATLVVTTGLMEVLGLIELEGVIAHELVHIKRDDVVVGSVAVTVLRPLAALTHNDTWLHRAVGPGREYETDQLAAAAVRYAPGLQGALEVLAAHRTPAADSVFAPGRLAATRWLWIDPMVGRRRGEENVGNLDATSVRTAALAQW